MKLLNKITNFFTQDKNLHQQQVVDSIVSHTNDLLENFENKVFMRFNEIQAEIKETQNMVTQLEKRLFNSELRGKQNVGHMTYKIEELSNKLKKSN